MLPFILPNVKSTPDKSRVVNASIHTLTAAQSNAHPTTVTSTVFVHPFHVAVIQPPMKLNLLVVCTNVHSS
jgi:hypothetical protein